MFQWVTSKAWQETMEWLYGEMVKFLSEFFGQINSMGAEIFDLVWIQAIVKFFSLFGWALFFVGLIVAVFDVGILSQTGQANMKTTAVSMIKGFFAVSLFTVTPVELYRFCISLQNSLSKGIASLFQKEVVDISAFSKNALDQISPLQPSIYNIFLLIALGYCVIKIFFANIKRGGILLIMIATGSLYMFSVPRGFTDGFLQWAKQIIAVCLTAFLQTTILIAGLLTWEQNFLLGLGLMLSASEVERIAGMFGLDTSVRGNAMSAFYATQSVVNFTKSMVSKAA